MFHVEGPGQVVICIFSRSTSCFHVCWAYILAYCRSHIIARLCDLVRNNFFSFKAAQNDSDVLVNIFQYPGHMNKLPDVVMSLIQTSLFLSHVALGWCTVCYVLCCTLFRHSLLSCIVLDIGDCYVSYTCNARPVLLYPLSCHFFYCVCMHTAQTFSWLHLVKINAWWQAGPASLCSDVRNTVVSVWKKEVTKLYIHITWVCKGTPDERQPPTKEASFP